MQSNLKKNQTKSTTLQSKESNERSNLLENSKNSLKKSQNSNIYSTLFGNTPEKEQFKFQSESSISKEIDKIKNAKSIQNLLIYKPKESNDNSNSSMPEFSTVNQIRRSLKEIKIYRKETKEQLSDSIILDMKKEKNKQYVKSKNIKVENQLKVIVNKSNFKNKSKKNKYLLIKSKKK